MESRSIPPDASPSGPPEQIRVKTVKGLSSIFVTNVTLVPEDGARISKLLGEHEFNHLPPEDARAHDVHHIFNVFADIFLGMNIKDLEKTGVPDEILQRIMTTVAPTFLQPNTKSMIIEIGQHMHGHGFAIFRDVEKGLQITSLARTSIAKGGFGLVCQAINLVNPSDLLVYKKAHMTAEVGGRRDEGAGHIKKPEMVLHSDDDELLALAPDIDQGAGHIKKPEMVLHSDDDELLALAPNIDQGAGHIKKPEMVLHSDDDELLALAPDIDQGAGHIKKPEMVLHSDDDELLALAPNIDQGAGHIKKPEMVLHFDDNELLALAPDSDQGVVEIENQNEKTRFLKEIWNESEKLEMVGGHTGLQDKLICVLARGEQTFGILEKKIICDLNNAQKVEFPRFEGSQDIANPVVIQDLLHQLLCGLDYLNLKGLKHGDIKPANIYLKLGLDGQLKAQIGDLGSVRSFREVFWNEDGSIKKKFSEVYGCFTLDYTPASRGPLIDIWKSGLDKESKLAGSGEAEFKECFQLMLNTDIYALGKSIIEMFTKECSTSACTSSLKFDLETPDKIIVELVAKGCPVELATLLMKMTRSPYEQPLSAQQALEQLKTLAFT